MAGDRFFCPDLDPTVPQCVLTGPEAHHLRTVLRAKVGLTLEVMDGMGRWAEGVVVAIDRHEVLVDISAIYSQPIAASHTGLTIAAALPKGDRTSWLIEKLTELGAAELVPLRTARSVTHPHKEDKLQRTVIEACKQCGRRWLMPIRRLTEVADLIRDEQITGERWILDVAGAERVQPVDIREASMAMVGPEGGWTDAERQLAGDHGWRSVRLPGHVLRMETAALLLAAWRRAVTPS